VSVRFKSVVGCSPNKVYSMDLGPKDLLLLYLYEMESFEAGSRDEVDPTLSKEVVCVKCGIPEVDFDTIVQELKVFLQKRKKKLIRRKGSHDCLFLNTKGVVKAKEIISMVEDKRVDFIDERETRKNLKIIEIRKEMASFDIEMNLFDLYILAKRNDIININQFITPTDWKKGLFSDHAYPYAVVLSNTSCVPFGGIFTTFGENGIVLPVNKKVEVGVHDYGSGEVIRWMKRSDGRIKDAYNISGKRGFESLVSGHSPMIDKYDLYAERGVFKDRKDYLGYFEVLKKYDYSIIFESGTGHGISIAGHVGTIMAALAIHLKDGIEYPFNTIHKKYENRRMKDNDQIPVWDLSLPCQPQTIGEMITEGCDNKEDIILHLWKKFITLSQVFESHWNSFIQNEDMAKVKSFKRTFGMRDFSSGGACLSSTLGVPILLELEESGHVSFNSMAYPEMPRNHYIGLIIDHSGKIDNPKEEFVRTFKRFLPLIERHPKETLEFFSKIKSTSGSLSRLASKALLENETFADPESESIRSGISSLMLLQRGIYDSLGIRNNEYESLISYIRNKNCDIVLSPVGVGNSGTYLFCIPDIQNMHTLRIAIEEINKNRSESQMIELVLHGLSHSYIFNSDPLMVVKNVPDPHTDR